MRTQCVRHCHSFAIFCYDWVRARGPGAGGAKDPTMAFLLSSGAKLCPAAHSGALGIDVPKIESPTLLPAEDL